ncbi:MAG: site-specific DNA-methyltransferase, partial [Thermoguttaceae bacterium]|nr:site-specific DNA-methyltransferase [Thermoguttaceae bacterium]
MVSQKTAFVNGLRQQIPALIRTESSENSEIRAEQIVKAARAPFIEERVVANFYETVLTVLKQDDRFFAEDGTFLRNAVYEKAMKMDERLIRLLLANNETCTNFFTDVDGIKFFDKIGFAWVINNRQFLQDSYTRYKNAVGLAGENGELLSSSGSVELVFPFNDCVLEGGQTNEDQKRQEIFYNETLAPEEVDRLLYPKVLGGARLFSSGGAQAIDNFNDSNNLIIRGNNVLALSSLCGRYTNRIQFIYIDPPYNTANDSFKYNDTFKRSTWLSFMKTRIQLAQKLLRESGVIAIQINYKEYSYLKVLCDELLGEENYVTTVTIKTATTASFRAINDCPVNVSEFIVIYAKHKAKAKIKPVYVA